MKCYKKTTAHYLFLALIIAGLVFSGCGKSKSGGGGETPTPTPDTTWYEDSDGDGFGNLNKTTAATDKPEGYVDNSFDCNDTNSSISPAASESTDGIDNNCNDIKDEKPEDGIIPDTGQVASYTDTPGEDSDYLINRPSYTKLDANGADLPDNATSWKMVRDNVTKLIWELKDTSDDQKNPLNPHDADNIYTFEEATTVFIAALNSSHFGNFNDGFSWRMPSIKELSFLANNTGTDPCITTTYFPLVKTTARIWSGTPSASDSTKSWFYNISYNQPLAYAKSSEFQVWAVRGEEKTSEFEVYGSSIIKDKKTNLMWQKISAKGDEDKGMTFEDAVSYCENLELGGFKDWRLPSRNELMSLVEFNLKAPAIDPLFLDMTDDVWYWTSTTFYNAFEKYAWSINFYSTGFGYLTKADLQWVRAVRGGKNSINKTWYRDGDSDGYGDEAVQKTLNSSLPAPEGYVDNNTDCNDAQSTISPGAAEILDDGIDQNCTGKDKFTWYKDSDYDGFGDQAVNLPSETQPETYVHNAADIEAGRFDCDDSNESINPAMVDLVDDGLDNNCNGIQNKSWYLDSDGDGYGNGQRAQTSELDLSATGYSTNDYDCDDINTAVHPGLVELLEDLFDTNCNGDDDDESLRVIPDTGQVSSYTGVPGEDGDYSINPPLLTKIDSSGTPLNENAAIWVAVYDEVTDLYWEVKTTSNRNAGFTYTDALDYAETLEIAGFDDWRIPTMTELATIANLDLDNPAIDSFYFPNMVSEKYWTVTDHDSATSAQAISFRFGESYIEQKTDFFRVISVRGGQSLATRLITNSDGTVTDTLTGLIWNNLLTTDETWNNTVDQWSGTSSANHNDWRLPTENDINTLLDILEEDDSFDFSGIFTNITLTGSFWTSTLAVTDPGKAIIFSFITGETDELALTQTLRGIGVRGIKQSRFISNADGTVFDTKTGLMWMQENGDDGEDMTFETALSLCDTLSFASYNDWRLPSRNEMISLLEAYIDDSESFSSTFPFPDSEKKAYWTSSSCPGLTDSDYAWQISFKTGAVSIAIGDYTNENFFRAVRGGNPE